MRSSRWHGHDDEDGRKIWSVEDCPRNRFQLGFLMGEDVYAWFDRELIRHDYSGTRLNGEPKEMMPHQCDLSDSGLTYRYQLWAAEMGVGKTLSAQKVIEKSGVLYWWWVGPKSSIPNIKREFARWGFDFAGPIRIEFITYEELKRRIDEWQPGTELPQGVIFDESSRLKGDTSHARQPPNGWQTGFERSSDLMAMSSRCPARPRPNRPWTGGANARSPGPVS